MIDAIAAAVVVVIVQVPLLLLFVIKRLIMVFFRIVKQFLFFPYHSISEQVFET